MKKEIRTAVYDDELRLEAYRLTGTRQTFPRHFHGYYVIGLVEEGERCLFCRDREYVVRKGDVILFNPGDSHGCIQADDGTLDYRGLNIAKEVMLDFAWEVLGKRVLPGFFSAVIQDEEAAECFRLFHEMVMNGEQGIGKEEQLLLLMAILLERYAQKSEECAPQSRDGIDRACAFMEAHYADRLSLDQICAHAHLSKSTLLRAFTKEKGVTPYCYLENIRIGEAKKLLEQGDTPMQTAMRTGFFDQSHFTNCFNRYIGLSPGTYRGIFRDKREKRDTKNEEY